MGMNILAGILLIVLAYIMQVLLVLAYPYYEYKQNHKRHEDRTIGGLVNFTKCIFAKDYLLLLTPFIGLSVFILGGIIGLIIIGWNTLYNKYIKNIKI